MTAPSPRVSVLITAFNRQEFVGAAIASALASQLSDIEVIVVDDNSTDGTRDAVTPYLGDTRVRFFRNETNLGDNANRNRAAAEARGEYLKYLDSDDIIYPHALGVFVAGMEAYPEAGLGLSQIPADDRPYPEYLSPRDSYLMHYCHKNLFGRAPGSAIIRRSAFEAVGGFGSFPGRGPLGDLDLWLRLAARFGVVMLPRDLVWDRQHGDQESAFQAAQPVERRRKERDLELSALRANESPLEAHDRETAELRLKERDAEMAIRHGLATVSLTAANDFRIATGVSFGMVVRTLVRRVSRKGESANPPGR